MYYLPTQDNVVGHVLYLLLMSGRRFHDFTLLHISPDHIQENGTNVVLWSIFHSKTDTAQHQLSEWNLALTVFMLFVLFTESKRFK